MTTEDIVTRLRNGHGEGCSCFARCYCECGCDAIWAEHCTTEAADEIERLRAELTQANNAIKLLIAIETAGAVHGE